MINNNFVGYIKNLLNRKLRAFTLVEVVIALTIIGVVTVLTLPTLQANVEDLIFKVRKKVLLTRVSQALPLLDTLRDFHSAEDFLEQYRDLVKVHMVCAGDKLPLLTVLSSECLNHGVN